MEDSDLSSLINSIQKQTSSIFNAFGLLKGVPETIKQMTDNVTDLDSTLTHLAKTASLSSSELAKLTESAYTVGERISRAGKEVLEKYAEVLAHMGNSPNLENKKIRTNPLAVVTQETAKGK